MKGIPEGILAEDAAMQAIVRMMEEENEIVDATGGELALAGMQFLMGHLERVLAAGRAGQSTSQGVALALRDIVEKTKDQTGTRRLMLEITALASTAKQFMLLLTCVLALMKADQLETILAEADAEANSQQVL